VTDREIAPREEQQDAGEGMRPTFVRYLLIGLGSLIAVILVGLIIALVGGAVNSEGVANFFRILRDFFIIVLALQGILISVALVVLILQLSSLINLLTNEIKPLVDETRITLTTIRGTTQFVSRNVTAPVIKAAAVFSGVRTFLGELGNIRGNVNGTRGRRG
jgi:hypothetical protein